MSSPAKVGQATQLAVVPAQSPSPKTPAAANVSHRRRCTNLLSWPNSESHQLTPKGALYARPAAAEPPPEPHAASQCSQQGLRCRGSFSVDGSGLDRGQPSDQPVCAGLCLPCCALAEHPCLHGNWPSMAVAGKRGQPCAPLQGQTSPSMAVFLWQDRNPHRGASISGYSIPVTAPRYVSLISKRLAGSPTSRSPRCCGQVQIVKASASRLLEAVRRHGGSASWSLRTRFLGPALADGASFV